MWLRRHFFAFVILFAALVTIAEGSLPRAGTYRMEEPCGVVLIGACLPRRVAAWERTQGTIVENVQGFTLIELSIVLVVIGLIVGGVLVGQDLIKAAETRAQIAQIEKFNSAVNAFRNKYNGIPGDLALTYANQFGFSSPAYFAGTQGERDGNGLIDGGGGSAQLAAIMGENEVFWTDLGTAGFLDANITYINNCYCGVTTPATGISTYLPAAKIGMGHFLHVYESGGNNWFMLAQVTGSSNSSSTISSNAALPVAQAYNIDKKIDDGNPTAGTVVAVYINNAWNTTTAPSANPDTASTCYNNSTNTYSMSISNGANPNCALSFKMQGAAR